MKMKQNKKAQQIFVSMMVAIIILILVVIMVNPLKTEIQKSTNGTFSTHLNSSNPAISVEEKATTIILDMGLFYFVGILVACSVCFISGKKTFASIITAIMTFIITTVLISPLKTLIVLGRDADHLNCASATITVGGKLSCVILDIWLFYFVVVMISVALSYIFITKVLPEKK